MHRKNLSMGMLLSLLLPPFQNHTASTTAVVKITALIPAGKVPAHLPLSGITIAYDSNGRYVTGY